MEFELVSEYPVTARKLFDLLRAPAFQEALALRFGALEVSAGEAFGEGDLLRMKMEQVDPGRDMRGRVDRGKRERFVVEFEWDLDRMESAWRRFYPQHGSKMRIEGRLAVEVLGREACRLVERFTVDIRTPLVGKAVEKKIIETMQEIQPRRVDFIMKRLGISE